MGERMLARKKHEGSLTAEKPSNPEDTRSLAAQFSDMPQSGTKLTRVQQRRSQPPPYTSFQTPIFQSIHLPWDTTLTGGGIWFPKPLAMKRVDRPWHNDSAEELRVTEKILQFSLSIPHSTQGHQDNTLQNTQGLGTNKDLAELCPFWPK